MNRTYIVLLVLVVCSVMPACFRRAPVKRMAFPAMGTIVEISLGGTEEMGIRRAIEIAQAEIESVEEALSTFRSSSELSRINRSAHRGAHPVGNHVRKVCDFALGVARWSAGAFDPTVGPLMDCWGFRNTEIEHPPEADSLRRALNLVGWRKVKLTRTDDDTWRIEFDQDGLSLDFGGIAKGYAVDCIDKAFQQQGARNYMVNAGGNILCRGAPSPERKAWKIGIRNPFDRGNEIIGHLELTDGMAVATSGNYERFRTIGENRYAHIIDPRSGFPVSGMAGVTVLASSAIEADALSTALFVLDVKEGKEKMKDSFDDVAVLFIPDVQPIRMIANREMRRILALRAPFQLGNADDE